MDFDSIDRTVDVRGQICPYPIIEIKAALKKLAEGQVLELLTDHEPAVRTTVPAFCGKVGYPYDVRALDRKNWRALIRKSATTE
jgi:TusA-related sulfurtransferase